MKPLLFSLLLFVSPALSQSALDFLEPVKSHPAVQASAAALAAAQAQLGGAYSPVSATLSSGLSAFDNDTIDLAPEVPGVQGLPGTGGQFSADVSFRPFAFGDIGDLVNQRQLNLEQARLSYFETLTSFESQALTAALGVQLAENSLELARQGAELAETALAATRLRFEKGAAAERDLRDAEANLAEAENFAQRAASDLELARLNLTNLVGDAALPTLPTLPLVEGTPLSVRRAQINVALAQVGQSSAARDLYPVVQAGYTQNLGDRGSVGVSLESRTLQPTLNYTYQNPGRSAAQAGVNGSFQVGVALNFNPGSFQAAEAAQSQVTAAQAGLTAAQDGALIQRRSLDNGFSQAQQTLALEELQFRNAQRDFEEAQTREELGLSSPLETQAELIDLLQADLELRAARQSVLSATLDFYQLYGMPVSEVLK